MDICGKDDESEVIGMNQYGLLGEKLSHSFSKIIHEKLERYHYDLLPMDKDTLHAFLRKKEFKGLNVTIPYKQEVIPFCDIIDETAEKIGAVNTIVNENGVLTAYNTDFYGFLYTLKKNKIDVENKIVYILGSGGTCKTVKAVMEFQKAKKIVIVSRIDSEEKISYEQAISLGEAQIIVNASPKGMFPNTSESPINLANFPQLEAVVDVIYNPMKTRLLQQAQERNIVYVNGLLMLVAQAVYAAQFFLDETFSEEVIDKIYYELRQDMTNLVVVGMPSAGKSTIGRIVAQQLNRDFVDLDSVIEEQEGSTIPQIFEQHGEEYFRKIESRVLAEVSVKTGLVIATGGGALLKEENCKNLKQNGLIIFIDREIELLHIGGNRPLSKSRDALEQLYQTRYPIYCSVADIIVKNNGERNGAIEAIKESFYEAVRN